MALNKVLCKLPCITGFNAFQVVLIVMQQCFKLAATSVECLTPAISSDSANLV
jgi:hypothetical protein